MSGLFFIKGRAYFLTLFINHHWNISCCKLLSFQRHSFSFKALYRVVQSLPLAKPSATPCKLQIQRHLRLFVSSCWEDLQCVFFRKMKCQFSSLRFKLRRKKRSITYLCITKLQSCSFEGVLGYRAWKELLKIEGHLSLNWITKYDLFIKARIHPQIHLSPHSPSSWM